MNRGCSVCLYLTESVNGNLMDCNILLNDVGLMCIFVRNAG